ncbi:MAG: molybdate ABC transporter substrate-binding protein [Deltaproteobacteria bacterium]|nr:molybdate ABC transporter substrate-binding protein [Deltaproteobacteria bacterium]
MRFLNLLFIFFISFFALPSAGAAAPVGSINVAAASDLTFALKEIAAGFEKDNGVKVRLSFGSTGMLAKQIESGAPFDVFFAADLRYIDGLKKALVVMPDSVTLYAEGRIVLAVREASSTGITGLKDLLKPGVKRIAIANPAHAPYGRAAMEALKKEGLWEKVRDKLVYGENIRQTLQFIETGNAEAGIIALSVAGVPGIKYTEIDSRLHNPIDQAAGVVAASKEKESAEAFIKYVKGPAGRLILKKYGFVLPRK